jgi:hypothetical protein
MIYPAPLDPPPDALPVPTPPALAPAESEADITATIAPKSPSLPGMT